MHSHLLPPYVILGGLRDKPYALQHIGDVVDPSLLDSQCLSSFIQVQNPVRRGVEQLTKPLGESP